MRSTHRGVPHPARSSPTPAAVIPNHNFGIAFDIGVFESGRYLPDSPRYKAVGALGVDLGLEWGGNWKSILDQPHFLLRPAWAAGLPERQMLAALRDRRAQGQGFFT